MGVMLTIHMDPIDTKDPVVSRAKEYVEEITRGLEGVVNFHDLRAVSGPTHTNIVFDLVVEFDCKYSDEELRKIYFEELQKFDSKFIAVVNIDKKYA